VVTVCVCVGLCQNDGLGRFRGSFPRKVQAVCLACGYPCGLAGRGLGPEVLEELADGRVRPEFCADRVMLSGCRLEIWKALSGKW
jgi:hypothetical protein